MNWKQLIFKKGAEGNKYINKVITNKILNLRYTLLSGQCFQWQYFEKQNTFFGVLNTYMIGFRENTQGEIEYTSTPQSQVEGEEEVVLDTIYDYFQFGVNIEQLREEWCDSDNHFKKVSQKVEGLRIIRENPFVCLVSFICSQNNNIKRNTVMLGKLRQKYGVKLDEYENRDFYSFPKLCDMQSITEQDLRELGLGYRAKYLVKVFNVIQENGGEEWLYKLRQCTNYTEKIQNLVSLDGIGRKVADCIGLFSLDCTKSIPCDTHVKQIYQKIYSGKIQNKTLSDKDYNKIQEFFWNKFGEYAGWAHSYLFLADLNSFKDVLDHQDILVDEKKQNNKRKKQNDSQQNGNQESMEIESELPVQQKTKKKLKSNSASKYN